MPGTLRCRRRIRSVPVSVKVPVKWLRHQVKCSVGNGMQGSSSHGLSGDDLNKLEFEFDSRDGTPFDDPNSNLATIDEVGKIVDAAKTEVIAAIASLKDGIMAEANECANKSV